MTGRSHVSRQNSELTHSEELYQNPRHPYTEALLSAIPYADPDMVAEEILLEGNVPDPNATVPLPPPLPLCST